MKRTIALCSLASLSALVACTPATYKDSRGNDLVVSLDQPNIQDFNQAADKMVQSMMVSGVLERAPRKPAVMGISRIVNDTSSQFDTDQLTKKIRVALLNTGKIEVTNTIGLGGAPEDPMAKGVQDMKDFESGNANKAPDLPDYTLTAKILENRASAGDTRQVSYIFQMSLTDTRSGRGVWEGEETITKQGQKNTVGF
ncbi:MAG: penicillin-binding protein activator LpoB [Planctomycetes bacterium]|nr:penicillin-binding protein activator LpoB [Planctomycetota bacterium]